MSTSDDLRRRVGLPSLNPTQKASPANKKHVGPAPVKKQKRPAPLKPPRPVPVKTQARPATLGAAFALPKKRFTQEEIEHARELRAIARKKREAELRVVEAVAVEHEIVTRRLRNGSISCEVGLSDVIEALLIEE